MTSVTDRSVSDPGTERLQAAASDVASEAGRTADRTAARTLDQAADAIDQVCAGLRSAESELRDTQPQLAGLLGTATSRMDGAASYLRDREPAEVLDDAQEVARRQPAVVVAGGLLLGLALGRLLRSTAEGGPARTGGSATSWKRGDLDRYAGRRAPTRGSSSMVGTMDPALGSPARSTYTSPSAASDAGRANAAVGTAVAGTSAGTTGTSTTASAGGTRMTTVPISPPSPAGDGG